MGVPADDPGVLRRGIRRVGERDGLARQHAGMLHTYGFTQIVVCVTKMDSNAVCYSEERFRELVDETKKMLVQVGFKKELVDQQVAFIPLAAWKGCKLVQPSKHMPWWTGCGIQCPDRGTITVSTLAEAFEKVFRVPQREINKELRMPVTGLFKIKGAGDVVTGRIAQGALQAGRDICFVGSSSVQGTRVSHGKVFTCEMHHERIDAPSAGDIVGLNIKGIDKQHFPQVGDVICSAASPPKAARRVSAQIMILSVANDVRIGWAPVCHAHTAQTTIRLSKILWKIGKETGGKKLEDPVALRNHEMAGVEFILNSPILLEGSGITCGITSRFLLADHGDVACVGKVTAVLETTP